MTQTRSMAQGSGTLPTALYVVATPIGNLADITLRALDVLRRVDLVACEDTRHTRGLLAHHGIAAELLALHEHNEEQAAQRLVAALAAGRSVALVSDAGTPGVSDPGARAVARVREAGFRVVPIPGANAAIAALSAAGLAQPHVLFYGFLPPKPAARREAIAALRGLTLTLVFYEAPHRVRETVADLAALLEGERSLVVARELTKVFESVDAMPLHAAAAWFDADPNRERGEFVLILGAAPPSEGADLDHEAERVLALLLEELPLKQAVHLAAQIGGAPRNALYRRALELKSGGS
jgi:16S rRNA (cytidine1402-2'-O)-methyltransferase